MPNIYLFHLSIVCLANKLNISYNQYNFVTLNFRVNRIITKFKEIKF